MELLTWGEIKSTIQKKHGIEGDTTFDENELVAMVNEAINKVEARVLTLNQDYFLTRTSVSLLAGETSITLPSDIYASKIRRVFIKQGSKPKRKLFRAKNLDEMEVYSDDYYDVKKLRYVILNGVSERTIELSHNNFDSTVDIYYTKNSNKINTTDGDSQICNIPEYADAVMAWMSYLIEFRDKTPAMAQAKDDYNSIIRDLVDTLSVAVNDEDNTIEPDFSFHADHI